MESGIFAVQQAAQTFEIILKKVKFSLLTSIGPGADPGVQAVSLQVTFDISPGSRLPLLSARPAVTFPPDELHCLLISAKLYFLVTAAHRCE